MVDFDAAWLDPIYATALKPSLWPDVLERLCAHVDAVAGSINRIDPLSGKASLFFEHGTDPAYTEKLVSTYARMSPIGSGVLTAEVEQPLTVFDFIDEDEYVASRFYKEWCAPQGYFDMLGAILLKSPTDVSAISTVRALSAGRFEAEQRAFVAAIAPHVRRAVTISGLLEAREMQREALATVVDALAAAVFIVEANGRLLRNNASGEVLLRRRTVLVREGVMSFVDGATQSAWRGAMARADGRPALIPMTADGMTYVVALLPVRATGPFAVVVNQQAPDSPAIGGALMQAFGLTPREFTILAQLLKGLSIEEAAAELGIEVATARSHLHRIFAKTGTARQGELIQKVLVTLPPIAAKG